jgi:hypothetical protein
VTDRPSVMCCAGAALVCCSCSQPRHHLLYVHRLDSSAAAVQLIFPQLLTGGLELVADCHMV